MEPAVGPATTLGDQGAKVPIRIGCPSAVPLPRSGSLAEAWDNLSARRFDLRVAFTRNAYRVMGQGGFRSFAVVTAGKETWLHQRHRPAVRWKA